MGNKTIAVAAAVALLSSISGNNDVGNVVSAFSSSFPQQSLSLVQHGNNNHQLNLNHHAFMTPSPSSTSSTSLHMSAPPLNEPSTSTETANIDPFPQLSKDGLYQIMNADQHKALLAANPNKIVIIKFFAPWCRACKGLAPKFLAIVNSAKYADLPIVWGEMTIQGNKDYIKSLGVLALPSMQFYAGSEGIVENFPCGPSKVPILKTKLTKIIEERIDPVTNTLKEVEAVCEEEEEAEACAERMIAGSGETTVLSVGDVVVSETQMNYLRNEIPYFKDFTDEEFDGLMRKATLVTFEPGSVIMRQGSTGKEFYVIESGEVEISVKAAFEDPLTTPAGYLGAVINTLTKNNYFGERALITGEPRAASIRASEKTRCFKFDVDDIPASSVLSGKKEATVERKAQIDDKYGIDVYDIDFIKDQFKTANVFNQARGSIYTTKPIADTEEEQEEEVEAYSLRKTVEKDSILSLLVKFQMIRHATRCFDYILMTKPKWGDVGEMTRRSILASKLTKAKVDEFTEVFKIMDHDGNGKISVLELKRVVESTGGQYSDEELTSMINLADPSVDGNDEISFSEFIGVMAEAEFYYLFRETFSMLDKFDSGFVKAEDLDRVLSGVRDLVSDDRMSIIDVEDKEMMIDYDSFSKMLLGSAI